jgi:hypothetical protein
MDQDQLRAKTLALFHSLVSTWANDLRGDVLGLQDTLNRELDALQERMAKYEESIDENQLVAFSEEVGGATSGAGGDGGHLSLVRHAMTKLDGGQSLTDILSVLVDEVGQFVPRVALFVLKGGSCIGWSGQGFDQTPGFSNDALKRISVPASADTVFRAVIDSKQSYLGESSVHHDNVQLLTRIGNVLPSSIFATPLLLRDRVAAVLYADSGDSRDSLEGTEALEILSIYACRLLDLRSGRPGKTGELQSERSEKLKVSTSPPVASPQVAPAPEPTPTPTPEATPAPIPEPEDSGTVMLDASDVASSPAVTPPPPTPAPAPAPGGDKQHEDAKRFARLLVSEIKLYNESKVQEGRKNKDLYQQLKEDIERSRKLYSERYPDAPPQYFDDELVRVLADGDTSALGPT